MLSRNCTHLIGLVVRHLVAVGIDMGERVDDKSFCKPISMFLVTPSSPNVAIRGRFNVMGGVWERVCNINNEGRVLIHCVARLRRA